jgi:gliding motility-associated-like protein
MKNIYLLFFLFLSSGLIAQSDKTVFHGCATDALHRDNAALRQAQNDLDTKVAAVLNLSDLKNLSPAAVYTIPVVIHIIHQNGAENISDVQAQTAIANLNTAFQQNGSARIQFCLAQRDPQGNATTGITRTVSPLTNMIQETQDIAVKNLNRWQPTCYLNIWVVKEITSQSSIGTGVVGYAYFPAAHGQNMDGLIIEAAYFGVSAQIDAVATHEIGHYLGLYHTFEGGCANGNCLQEGDRVCDTPPDQTTFAVCAIPTNSCSTDTDDASANNPLTTDTPDYGDDYMDYSDFACYTRFTPGQYNRMQYFLTNVRRSLLACQSCLPPCLSPITLSLSANNTSVTTGISVIFTSSATNATGFEYYINPSTSLGASQNLSYTFNSAGSFWVKCKATSGTLCSAIDSVLITVTCNAQASFTVDNPTIELGQSFSFTNFTTNATNYTWTVDNIAVSTVPNYTYTPAITGSYSVCLTANNAQCSSVTCRTVYAVLTGVQTDCGNTFIRTLNWNAPIDANGVAQWDLNNLYKHPSGDFFLTGSKGDSVLLVRLRPNGNTVWQRAFKFDTVGHSITALMVDSDDNIVGAGRSAFSGTTNSSAMFIFKYNEASQTILWNKQMVTPSASYYIYTIHQTDATHYVFNGSRADYLYTLQVNKNDGTIGAFEHTGIGGEFQSVYHNGAFYGASRYYFSPYQYRPALYKWDAATGNPVWTKTYIVTTTGQHRVYNTPPIIDNNSILQLSYGTEASFANFYYAPLKLWFSKTDIDGTLLWTKEYTIAGFSRMYGTKILNTATGYYLILSLYDATLSQYRYSAIIKIDKDGNVEWAKRYGIDGTNTLKSVVEHNGYLFATGVTGSYGHTVDGIFMKLGTDGNTAAGCNFIEPLTVTVQPYPSVELNVAPVVRNQTGAFVPQPAYSNPTYFSQTEYCATPCVEICDNFIDDDDNGLIDEDCPSCPVLTVSTDTTICAPNTVQLAASANFTTYAWSPVTGLSNPTIRNPIATPALTTTYIVTATHTNSVRTCTSIDTVKVRVRVLPTLNIGADIAMCNSATRTFDAGAGFAEYLWQDGSTNRTFTAFGSGKYWVTVKDSCGNIQADTVLITQGAPITMSLGPDRHFCINAIVQLNYMHQGVLATYQWSEEGGGTSTITCPTCATTTLNPTISPTKYYLAVSTSDGCTALDSNSVYIDTLLTATRFDTICFGASLTYNNHIYTQAGIYIDTITTAGVCDSIITTNLFVRPNLSYTMHEVRGACTFSNDGSAAVVINALPNYAPYTYDWGGSNVSDTLRYISSGIYTVTITDTNGCTYTGSQTISVLPQPSYTFTQTPPSCAGFCNGTVTLTATGGSGVYTFSDTGGHTATNVGNVFTATGYCDSALPLDYFVITLIDANGCTAPLNQITMGHQTDPTKERFDTLCFGGSLIIGTHTYTTTGIYTDTILTNCCCDTIVTTHLRVLPEMTMTAVATNPTCWNTCDGSLQLTVTNGNPPFRYDYHHLDITQGNYFTIYSNSPNLLDATFCRDSYPFAPPAVDRVAACRDRFGCEAPVRVLFPYMPIPQRTQSKTICFGTTYTFNNHIYTQTGVYSDTIKTAGVCDSIIITDLTVRPAAVIAATQVKPRCDGYAPSTGDGIVAVSVANLPNYAPYTFIWNTGSTNDTINELPLGTYTVSVTDANNCIYSSTAVVTRATPLVATMQATDPTCWSRCNGTIRYDIVTGTPPFRYGVPTQWIGSPLVPTSATTYFVDTICYLPPIPNITFYTAIIDGNGCSIGFLVEQTAPDTLRRTQNITRCKDVPYLFNGHTYTQAGTYTDIIQTAGACDSIITTHLKMEEVTVSAAATVFNCFTNTGSINITNTTGGNPPYTYALGSGNFGITDNWTVTAADTYTVFAQDATGCTASATIAVQEPNAWEIDAGRDTTIVLGDSLRIMPALTTFSVMQYAWQPPTGLSCTTCKRPIATPTITTTYTVTATDSKGCTSQDQITITVKDNKNVYIPNVFTPNDDGKNDFFTAFGGNNILKITKMQIFDRWGESVYAATDIPLNGNTKQTAWDGNFNGKPLNPGVFVYAIEIEFTNGKTRLFKGDVTLLRD